VVEVQSSGSTSAPRCLWARATQVAFTHDGDGLISLYRDASAANGVQRVALLARWRWDGETWSSTWCIELGRDSETFCRPKGLPFSAGARWAAYVPSRERLISVIDLESGKTLGRVGFPDEAAPLRHEFLPDGRTLLVLRANGTLQRVPWADLLGVPS